jgi:hypothetical protein
VVRHEQIKELVGSLPPSYKYTKGYEFGGVVIKVIAQVL